jgi:hypothetical protein
MVFARVTAAWERLQTMMAARQAFPEGGAAGLARDVEQRLGTPVSGAEPGLTQSPALEAKAAPAAVRGEMTLAERAQQFGGRVDQITRWRSPLSDGALASSDQKPPRSPLAGGRTVTAPCREREGGLPAV